MTTITDAMVPEHQGKHGPYEALCMHMRINAPASTGLHLSGPNNCMLLNIQVLVPPPPLCFACCYGLLTWRPTDTCAHWDQLVTEKRWTSRHAWCMSA